MSQVPASLVSVVAEKAVASSLEVAARFGKKHQHVLRSIKKHLEDMLEVFDEPKIGHETSRVASNFGRNYFVESSYTDTFNKKRPMYYLTRDGFSLLAMSFTGKAALVWKMRYVQAFNAMEVEILRSRGADIQLRAERIFLAGSLYAMLERETDRRKDLIKQVLEFSDVRYTQRKIADIVGVSVYVVRRILRRYSRYKNDFYRLEICAREYDPARRKALQEVGRQYIEKLKTKQAARELGMEARHAALPRQ